MKFPFTPTNRNFRTLNLQLFPLKMYLFFNFSLVELFLFELSLSHSIIEDFFCTSETTIHYKNDTNFMILTIYWHSTFIIKSVPDAWNRISTIYKYKISLSVSCKISFHCRKENINEIFRALRFDKTSIRQNKKPCRIDRVLVYANPVYSHSIVAGGFPDIS